MQKSAVRDAIVAQLQRELDLQARAAHESREEATSTENKQEGKFDMRGQEAAYLAEGQARLAAEIAESIVLYRTLELPDFSSGRPAALGAVITLETKGRQTTYFLGPRNGGMEINEAGESCLVVTPSSPLGRQLLGRVTGDSVQLPGRTGAVSHKVVALA
ncbi:GreA/GreB family elongation factor [Rariglobus hedericola]|uniref:GreA/GreB family elongation factor n=1 Tax=Rariglobus hedericola TaxID=2597822 RepID=A0A556QNG6_9BACT|nr:GreA/GreB family elongation factor [Rariglobus hedericola]TSJ78169.1 GreA/GreB family elongation factor [Rariglobus hedericola]